MEASTSISSGISRRCYFSIDAIHDLADGIEIALPGNADGCPTQVSTSRELPISDRIDTNGVPSWAKVVTLLNEFEPVARDLDPQSYVACLFVGHCGQGQ
ncbi:hypothetical protein ACWCW7_13140 [Nocardia tengchongensis]